VALSHLERVYLNHPQPDTKASSPNSATTHESNPFGWQVTRRFEERQGFDSAPVADVFGRAQPSPREIQEAIGGTSSFPTEGVVYKRRKRRKDEVIVPEENLSCSTTRRQKIRVDQKKYRNRPQNKFMRGR
jgi:hypothetical protein